MSSRSILIFGASGGIGYALSTQLAAQGHQLMLAGRQADRLQEHAGVLGAQYLTADITDPEQASAAAEHTVAAFGKIDAVVNLAGSLYLKAAHRTTPEDFDEVIRVNLTSAFNTVRVAATHMKQGGSVVLISTVAAQLGLPNHEAISAAKAGVEGLARSAAATYASKKIRVNVVAPSLTRTPMTQQITDHEASLKASTAMHPLGRIGEPEDIASAVSWLLDPASEWITGQVIPVDGGLSTVRVR